MFENWHNGMKNWLTIPRRAPSASSCQAGLAKSVEDADEI